MYFDKVMFDDLPGLLRRYFEGIKVSLIDSIRIDAYIDGRLAKGAANASINRELATLKRMLNLGTMARKVD